MMAIIDLLCYVFVKSARCFSFLARLWPFVMASLCDAMTKGQGQKTNLSEEILSPYPKLNLNFKP